MAKPRKRQKPLASKWCFYIGNRLRFLMWKKRGHRVSKGFFRHGLIYGWYDSWMFYVQAGRFEVSWFSEEDE